MSSTKKTILVVHTGSVHKKFVLQRLSKMGLHVVCLNREKIDWALPYVDRWILADTNNHRECITAIKSFLANNPREKFDGVVTFWDPCTQLNSKIADAFNLIGIPYAIAKKVKNKYLLREFCNRNGIPAPAHFLLQAKKDIAKMEKKLKYPVVLKPVYGQSSACVMRANNRQELEENIEYFKNNVRLFSSSHEWENFDMLVEEFIDGEEVDMDILVQNGKIKFSSISDNFNKGRGRFFVDSGQVIPSTLPENEQSALLSMAEEALEKLNIQNGCIHFEAKSSKNGPFPLEINMRLGGDYIYSYTKGAWGVDLVEYSVKIALGEYIKIEKPALPLKYIIGWDLQPEYSGILVEQEIPTAFKELPFLEDSYLTKEVGDPVLVPPEGYDNLGWITISGANMLDAQSNLRKAQELLTFKVAAFDQESTLGKTARKNSLSAAVIKKGSLLSKAKIEKVRRSSRSDQRRLHIGITANFFPWNKNQGGSLLPEMVAKELTKRGYTTTILNCSNINHAIYQVQSGEIDLIFNAFEDTVEYQSIRPHLTALWELLGIPHTGASAENLALCFDKIRLKKILAYHNIPTPKWDYAYSLEDTISPDLRFPLIVKPSNGFNSYGITNASVVTTEKQLKKQLEHILRDLGSPVVVEEYIEGNEYHISILGSDREDYRVLPLARSLFKKMPRGHWHIYTHDIQKSSLPSERITFQPAIKHISPKLESLITEISLDAYKIMHCADYGRIEIRVDRDDNPYLIDIDPNPLLTEREFVSRAAQLVGFNFGDLLEEVIASTVRRYRNKII